MAPVTVLITGANRGIGLGLVRKFLEDTNIMYIFAACRKPSKELEALSDSRLRIVALDVDCDSSIEKAVSEVASVVGSLGLSLLINNAGVNKPYRTEDKTNRQLLASVINTNAVSVCITTQYFLPLLKMAAENQKEAKEGISRAAVVNISSYYASIGGNDSGSEPNGILPYRTSKSALNSITKTMAIDLEKYGILVAAYSPGWVKTDMGGDDADLTIEESMNQLVPTIYALKKEQNGGCFTRNGDVIPF